MPNEIWTSYTDGNTLYALVWRKLDDTVWSVLNSAFEAYTKAKIDELDIVMDNVATLSDYYSADFPVGITGTDPLAYRVQIILQTGGSPDADADFALAQGEIIWDGTTEIDLGVIFNSNQTTLNRYNEISLTVIDETITL